MEEGVGLEGAVEDVAAELDHFLVGVGGLEVADEEGVGAGDGDGVGEALEDGLLHVEDFGFGVGAVADVDEVAELGGVDLLVLGSDEEGRDADELELGAADLGAG